MDINYFFKTEPKDPVARKAFLDPSRLDKQQALLRTALSQNKHDRQKSIAIAAAAAAARTSSDELHSEKITSHRELNPEVLRARLAGRAARVAMKRARKRQELDATLATNDARFLDSNRRASM